MNSFPPGLYDLLQTPLLQKRLRAAGLTERAKWLELDETELANRFQQLVAKELTSALSDIFESKDKSALAARLLEALRQPQIQDQLLPDLLPEASRILHRITPANPHLEIVRPDTPLAVSALLTGSARSPALRTQFQKELASCDRADWLVSFIKYAGILPLLETLRQFTQTPASDGGPRLRIATTSYMGATDAKAIEELLKLPHTEIRVSYDTKRTRLHAKAYLFHRATGFSSAYIGSANISKAALDEGLEWTAKISQYETAHLWQHACATFESHWEDATEFSPCTAVDLPQLRQALARESGTAAIETNANFFDLRPYDYQKAILQDIASERQSGKHKHLIIAATGTGKTMVAAFDYKAFCELRNGRPRLLFVAHREEILKQAMASFRQVLRDGSFGEVLSDGATVTQHDHLFCTVQSWNSPSRQFNKLSPEHFSYVVLDEAHHASAESYQRLIDHVTPLCLLGLTATPERNDGRDIRDDFGGAFTHEIRLAEAIERALLAPFHYFGVPDQSEIDFSRLDWSSGHYDQGQLAALLETNGNRAGWALSQLERHVADLQRVRGLGFCVSVRHAEFMAAFFNARGVPAKALSAESPRELRNSVQQELTRRDIRFIFTVDLYNEGVDIPCVDTVLFLRPTESLTIFLQQLGRGLRLHDDKAQLTVLDFIAPQHRNFRYAKRFQALSSRPTGRIDEQLKNDMPFVPAGCLIHLERQAKEHVLKNIQDAAGRLRGQRLINELRDLQRQTTGELSLKSMLDFLQLDDPDPLYKVGLPHQLLNPIEDTDGSVVKLNEGFRRVLMMDDTHLLRQAQEALRTGQNPAGYSAELMQSLLWAPQSRTTLNLAQASSFFHNRPGLRHDLLELLDWLITHRSPLAPAVQPGRFGALHPHAHYTREQVLLALGFSTFEKPVRSEGTVHLGNHKMDLFFADINKSQEDYSPTTMYQDYAITDSLFHWQTPSTISSSSVTGQRYIEHATNGYTPLLFIRDRKKLANGLTAPYFFAGPLRYRKHEGSKPMSITWELADAPLPAKVLSWARRVG